jgi:hypothetical protein
MEKAMKVVGKDIKITDLIALNVREINIEKNNKFKKILSSIKAVGLIEPLSVYRENGKYSVLDGFLRLKACEKLKKEKLPCQIYKDKEAYTFNRMVNRLSPVQESRMLIKSLEIVDEPTIAKVFGLRSMKYRLSKTLLQHLHPKIINILDKNLITRRCAEEFTLVKPVRQLEILEELKRTNDYTPSLVRALIIKTPNSLKNGTRKPRASWLEDDARKRDLVKKLKSAEQNYDFYSNLYRQYSTDLLKLCVYVRKIITNENIETYLSKQHPDVLENFKKIVFKTQPEKN